METRNSEFRKDDFEEKVGFLWRIEKLGNREFYDHFTTKGNKLVIGFSITYKSSKQ